LELKETLNIIHVKEQKLTKGDLQRGIQIIEENAAILGTSDGFDQLSKKLGINSTSIFAKRSEAKLSTILLQDKHTKSQSYLELRNLREQEKVEKLKAIEEEFSRIKALTDERSKHINQLKQKAQKNQKQALIKEENNSKELELFKAEREKKLIEMKENFKKQQELRLAEKIKTDRELRKLSQGPLLYKSLNEKYNIAAETENLKKKKEVLANLRDLYKPIDFKKIEEEQMEKVEMVRQHNEDKRKQLAELQKQNEESYDFRKFNTKYITRVLEQDMDKQELEEQKEEYKRSLHQKMRSYNDTVKEKYGPVVSKSKQLELENRKKSLEVPAKEKYKPNHNVLSDREQERKRQIYLERMEVYNKLPKKLTSTPTVTKISNGPIDYLKEFRSSYGSQERILRDRGRQ